MDKDEIIVKNQTAVTEISDSETSCIIRTEIINELMNYTGDQIEAVELILYLKERLDSVNSTIETDSLVNKQKPKKIPFEPVYVEYLLKDLLSTGFTSEQIMNALDEIPDSELFEKVNSKLQRELASNIVEVTSKVREILGFNNYEQVHTYYKELDPFYE